MINNFLTYRDFLKSDFKKPDLIFTIKTFWFKKIWEEEKLEEYREIKPFYQKRLEKYHSSLFCVGFKAGYKLDAPFLLCDCRLNKSKGLEKWGAEKDKEYYILEIKKVYK